jgi:hypothetical protein
MTDSVEKHAVYAGTRLAAGGKLAHVWEVDGTELWFSKPTGGVIGGIYVLKMTPDLKKAWASPPKYTMERIDDKDKVASWEVHHLATSRARRRAAAERKHKANGVLDDATYSLDRIVAGLKSVHEVYVLTELLKEHLLDHYWKTRK